MGIFNPSLIQGMICMQVPILEGAAQERRDGATVAQLCPLLTKTDLISLAEVGQIAGPFFFKPLLLI